MLIVWYMIYGEREAIVLGDTKTNGVISYSKTYDCEYAAGIYKPHYPMPALDNTYWNAECAIQSWIATGKFVAKWYGKV